MAEKLSKQIEVIYPDDTYEIWESASKFARENGMSRDGIYRVLNGVQNTTHGGMRFEYVN